MCGRLTLFFHPFVMVVAPEADHLRFQNRQHGLDEQQVYRHHLHQVHVIELGTRIFPSKQMSHVFSGEWIAHAIVADAQDSSNPKRYMSHSRAFSSRRVQTKSRTCNFVSFRIQFYSRSQMFSFAGVRKRQAHHLFQAHQLWSNMEVLLESEKYSFPNRFPSQTLGPPNTIFLLITNHCFVFVLHQGTHHLFFFFLTPK